MTSKSAHKFDNIKQEAIFHMLRLIPNDFAVDLEDLWEIFNPNDTRNKKEMYDL